MARLAAQEKMLYYPTPTSIMDKVAPYIELPEKGIIRLFDPCAGEGEALAHLADLLRERAPETVGIQTWGVELNPDRAAKAGEVLDYVVSAPFEGVEFAPRTIRRRFSVALLNPPYDWDRRDDYGRAQRMETTFTDLLVKWVAVGGVVILVVPYKSIDYKLSEIILSRFDLLAWFRFGDEGSADELFDTFKQVVLVLQSNTSEKAARYKYTSGRDIQDFRSTYGDQQNVEVLKRTMPTEPLEDTVIKPEISYSGGRLYRSRYTEEEFRAALDETDMASSIEQAYFPASVKMRNPLLPLRVGHIAQVVAGGQAGTMNVGREVFKGSSIKVTTVRPDPEDKDGSIAKDHFQTHIVRVNKSGLVHLTEPEEIRDYLNENAGLFKRHIERQFAPYGGNPTAEEHAILDTLSLDKVLPGCKPGLQLVQRIAAVAGQRSLDMYNVSHLVGEMGTGKSRTAAAIAVLNDCWPILISCPPHLVEPWVEEFVDSTPGSRAIIIETLAELDAAIASHKHPKERLAIIVSHSRLKLGPGWEPQITGRRFFSLRKLSLMRKHPTSEFEGEKMTPLKHYKLARERYQEHRSEENLNAWHAAADELREEFPLYPTCPKCGLPLYGADRYSTAEWEKTTSTCRGTIEVWEPHMGVNVDMPCKGHLWQHSPKIARRWPIADYIKRRYPTTFGLLIYDEFHKAKSKSADRSTAFQTLAKLMPVVTATGTFFGGSSSSIFYMLYRTQAFVRADYGYEEERRWVERFGVIERKIPREDSSISSANTGRRKRRRKGGSSEKPGLSPEAIRYILPTTVFMRVNDFDAALPGYEEELVELDLGFMQDQMSTFDRWALSKMKDNYPNWTSSWLQWTLARPNSAFRKETVAPPSIDDEPLILPPWTTLDNPLLPKEEWLVKKIQEQRKQGRKVIVYLRQTGTRDIRDRLLKVIRESGVGKVLKLGTNVTPRKRPYWLKKNPCDVLVVNPRLVETGMNLHDYGFCEIVFYEIEYSLYTMWQAMRRVWRLGQTKDVGVSFAVYEGTQEATAIRLVGRKMLFGELLYGDDATSALVESDDSDTAGLVRNLIGAMKKGDKRLYSEKFTLFGSRPARTATSAEEKTVVSIISAPTGSGKSLDDWLTSRHGMSLSELRELGRSQSKYHARKRDRMVAAGQQTLF
jgi:hypothetical protein